MSKTIGTTITLNNKFTPVLNQIGQGIGAFNGKVVNTNKNVGNMANGFSNAFNKMSKGAKGAAETVGSSIKGIGMKVAGIAGVGFGADAFIKQTDAYTGIQARLQLINDDQQTVAQLNDKIFKSAGDARVEYNQMADVVGKLGINAKDAFKNNDEMVKFSELLTKNFKISGASAQEQTSAMYQLTQAMGSGKLQGDEFRSIMENAPLLAQAIAKEMKVPMGQLKEMGSQGKITSDVIKKSLFNSANDINKKFGEIPMTFSDVGNKIKNTVERNLQPTFKNMSKWLNSDGVGKGLETVLQRGQDMASGFANWVTPKLETFKNFVQSSLLPKFSDIGNSIGKIVENNGPALEGAFDSLMKFSGKLANEGLKLVQDGLNWFGENKEAIDGALGFIKGSFETLSKFIDGDFKGAFSNASGAIINLMDTFSDLTLQMRNSNNPVLRYLIGPALDIPVGLIEGASKGDLINRMTGNPADLLNKNREERAKSREINKNYNEMIDYYRKKYKDVKEDPHGTALPEFAKGTSYAPRGMALVGEHGPELVNFRGGETVTPNNETKNLLNNKQVVINNYLTIQGNAIGNDELIDTIGAAITNRVTLALGNM